MQCGNTLVSLALPPGEIHHPEHKHEERLCITGIQIIRESDLQIQHGLINQPAQMVPSLHQL